MFVKSKAKNKISNPTLPKIIDERLGHEGADGVCVPGLFATHEAVHLWPRDERSRYLNIAI
jgi:hypothetical protein